MNSPSPTKQRAARYIAAYLAIILFIISFGGGVFVGRTWQIKSKPAVADAQAAEIAQLINIDRSTTHSDSVDFAQFWQIWDRVKQKYVKQPVKDTDLFYGALQGMVYGLGDPYSMYFPPQPAKEFTKSLSGEFSGIGAEIGMKNNQIVVIAPLPGSPAFKAGLHPGDRILAIDKKITLGMDINTAVEKIRGPVGTTTTLTIAREGVAKPADYTILRAQINVPAVMYEKKPGNVTYLRIMQFNENTVPQFSQYIDKALAEKTKGIVIDLRNNPGGFLDAAISMASEWITDGTIVSEKFSDGHENTHPTQASHRLAGIKTVVLVNGGSASASEIVAGALQDHKVATIVGEKTFGKGSVQDFETLPDGSALKITVAEWYTPNGVNINQKGITPDIVLKENYEKEKIGQDIMVAKALELLRKKK